MRVETSDGVEVEGRSAYGDHWLDAHSAEVAERTFGGADVVVLDRPGTGLWRGALVRQGGREWRTSLGYMPARKEG